MCSPEMINRDGFVTVRSVVLNLAPLSAEIDNLLEDNGTAHGLRNVLDASLEARRLACDGPPHRLAATVLGAAARPVRGLVFDKTPAANWKVPWHQDRTIAVRRKIEVPGYGPWSVKAGVPHVQPPVHILERVVAVRLHLDDMDEDNGPLRVLPGSHRVGIMDDADIERWRASVGPIVCSAAAGDALLVRPLLLHASSPARRPRRRRVLHIEYASTELGGGLEWLPVTPFA